MHKLQFILITYILYIYIKFILSLEDILYIIPKSDELVFLSFFYY